MKQVDPVLLQVAVDAVANLKVPIDALNDPSYMEQVIINGAINNLVEDLQKLNGMTYGCFCDVDCGGKPDPVCVMDASYDGPITDCVYASYGGSKTDCGEWKPYLKKDYE